ncbi:MAG: GMP reductase [SAR202 cluster bacterium]|nr:GMP reductase [SAR202 cluster bacterium]
MKFEDGIKLDFDDVLIKPKRSTLATRSGVDIERSYRYLHCKWWESTIPIIAANMDTTGTFAMSNSLEGFETMGMQTALHKHYSLDDLAGFFSSGWCTNTWYTIGIKEEDVKKLIAVDDIVRSRCPTSVGLGIERICIDVANGYQKVFVDHVRRVRNLFPHSVIMAGNVCTPEMVSELLISGGADIVKIGIGPGSVCATRKITGCGYPQLSAIIECADAAHGVGGHICADGGCREAGDVVKAFAAGADFVMLGGMLAGTDECEGEWEYSDGGEKVALKFYGMSSEEAMNKHGSGMGSYRASEGIVKSVPYKGSVSRILQEITGGIRSACAYVGAPTLKDLPKCATFVVRRK